MAAQKDGIFKEQFSPFLLEKLRQARTREGPDSATVRAIERQYRKDPREDQAPAEDERGRHYDADIPVVYRGRTLRGVERLYRRVILVEPTTVCAAHCRWCLRGQYPMLNLSEEEIELISSYCGDPANEEVREVLVTGGDPFMIPDRLRLLLDGLERNAPNVRIVRIGTRVPVHEPARVNEKILSVLARRRFRIEVGTHVNHATELFPEVKEAHARLESLGVRIYNQSVLLKGVNDSPEDLTTLFDELRYLGIETHYLFHCIPMRGMGHHRTRLEDGLRLIGMVANSGALSGRGKPAFTAMTDIGKITLYDGVILEHDARNRVLLQSQYSHKDRLKWNPLWKLPDSAQVDADGTLQVWYLNGPSSP